MLKNKSNIYVVQVPSMATVKIVPSNDNVHVLLNLDGDVFYFLFFNLSNTRHFPHRTMTSTPLLVFVDVDEAHYNP